MAFKRFISKEEAQLIGYQLGINWINYNFEQFRIGLEVELEHGTANPATNVTDDDLILTGKIAIAHLNEFPDYYDRLKKMESDAHTFWNK